MAMTINGNGSITGLAVGGLPDGTVDNDTIAAATIADAKMASGGGKVLQVVIGVDTTSSTIATTTYTDTGLSATITPSSTSSKILCQWTSQAKLGNNEGMGVQLVRGSTNVYTSGDLTEVFTYQDSAAGKWEESKSSWIHLDSPATTSAITYKIQVASYNSQSVNLNNDSNETQLLLMEIGA